jgi:dihydroxyacetone kinase-like protein
MKKLINEPINVVHDSLIGISAAHRDILTYDVTNRILTRSTPVKSGKVGIVAGGGSGCEPTHVGFVGYGMLDAACPGEIFSSPVPDQIMAATRAVNTGGGILHVIKNYPGEVMNFDISREILEFEDFEIESVLINDDVAIEDSPDNAGRRGLGATVLLEKIAGAAAERGDDLNTVANISRSVNDRSRTFGVGLSSCTPPLRGKPIFELPDGEMEIGIGISGEPGIKRVKTVSASEIATLLIDRVLSDRPIENGTNVLVLVNGLGGTPQTELYLLYGELERRLRDVGLIPLRSLVGSYVTSLDQAGAALTLLELDDELIQLWDAPINTPALRWGI